MKGLLHLVTSIALLANFQLCCHGGVMYFQSQVGKMPKQVHVAFGKAPSQIVISWATQSPVRSPSVQFGRSAALSFSASAVTKAFRDPVSRNRVEYFHRATLERLLPGQRYSYKICSIGGPCSSTFFFKTMREGQDWSPRFAVYGDLGLKNPQSLPRLAKDVQAGMYDAVLHVGDFGYDLADNDSYVGDAFMEVLEPVAANIPYMTCPGNHEFHFNFTNYKARFHMPNDGGNMFYSFNVGPMHIISLSTEFYYFVFYGIAQIRRQYDWLVKDLKEANRPENRAKRPWILMFGHRPMYCSSNQVLTCGILTRLVRHGFFGAFGLEPLLKKYGVDIAIWGHEHAYERMWPIYDGRVVNSSDPNRPYTDPRGPVHIITGSAGCKERTDTFKGRAHFSAFRSSEYGYSRMQVVNASHLMWEQVSDDQGGKIIDQFTLVRNRHTPF